MLKFLKKFLFKERKSTEDIILFQIDHIRDLKIIDQLGQKVGFIVMGDIPHSIIPRRRRWIYVSLRPFPDCNTLSLSSDFTIYSPIYRDNHREKDLITFCKGQLERIFGKIPEKIFYRSE